MTFLDWTHLLNLILMHYGTRESKAAGKGQKESG